MAEFCLSCWNRINHTKSTERNWIFSKELDLCEGCGEWKLVIVRPRQAKWLYDMTHRQNE